MANITRENKLKKEPAASGSTQHTASCRLSLRSIQFNVLVIRQIIKVLTNINIYADFYVYRKTTYFYYFIIASSSLLFLEFQFKYILLFLKTLLQFKYEVSFYVICNRILSES